MKKVLIALMLIAGMFFYTNTYAETEATDLEETLKAENIKLSGDYKENDKQVTLYLFRGEGCSHCQELLEYLNSIVKKHGDKFKLRAYEVWNNEDNNELKEKAAKELEVEADGVPFLIIGENTFIGFGEDDKEKIVDAINKEYKKSSDERYNLMANIKSAKKDKNNENSALIVLIPILVFGVVIFLTRRPEEQ